MMYRMMNYGGGNWDGMPDYMKQMMQQYWGGIGPLAGLSGILDFITSLLVIALLVAAIRWLWKKGDK